MTAQRKSFYEELGVDRQADERTIKKAYFSLVRKFPPETHPEEFMRIREAYEVLSDANARREYDSVSQYDELGDGVSEDIRAALDAMDQERYADAQVILAKLLNEAPDLDFAKDLLGTSYLHDKKPEAALEIFDELVKSHPQNAVYLLHRGYALHNLEKYAQATKAYEDAAKLAPDDVRMLIALSDCLMDQRKWDEAIQVLDVAIHLDDQVDFKDFALFVRKLQVHIERRDSGAVTQVLAELMKVIPPEDQAKRFVADRLASLAAPLFAQERTEEANLLMREAVKLDPNRGTGSMPTSFTVDIDLLPEASREWLRLKNNDDSEWKLKTNKYLWPIVLTGVGITALWWALTMAFGSHVLRGAEFVLLWAGLAAGGALSIEGIRRWRAAAVSPYGAYTLVHPLYLLEVKLSSVTAWPLANLRDAKVTHHSTNGAYTHSEVRLNFATRSFSASIRGQEAAMDWANGVLKQRRRVLELMLSGMVEASSAGAPLIPASMIPEEGSAPLRAPAHDRTVRRAWIATGLATAAAALLTLIAAPIHDRRADDRDFSSAHYSYGNRVSELRGYLQRRPDGRHAAEAKAAIPQVYEDALTHLATLPPAPLGEALKEIVKALQQGQTEIVGVEFHAKTLESLDMSKLPANVRELLVDPKPAFSDYRVASSQRDLTYQLEQAFHKALGTRLISLVEERAATPVKLKISYEVVPNGSVYESVRDTRRLGGADQRLYLGVGFLWSFDIQFAGESQPRYSVQLQSEPAKTLRWSTFSRYGGYESATLPYEKMAHSAFTDFQEQLASQFGVRSERRRDEREYPEDNLDGAPRDEVPAPALANPKRRSKRAKTVEPVSGRSAETVR